VSAAGHRSHVFLWHPPRNILFDTVRRSAMCQSGAMISPPNLRMLWIRNAAHCAQSRDRFQRQRLFIETATKQLEHLSESL
jgi:hypothetical protein